MCFAGISTDILVAIFVNFPTMVRKRISLRARVYLKTRPLKPFGPQWGQSCVLALKLELGDGLRFPPNVAVMGLMGVYALRALQPLQVGPHLTEDVPIRA